MSLSNLAWSRACAEILLKLGVQYICISPGSRNSPLTIGFTENKELKCFSFIDERSGGFFALGLAKSTLNPVVLLSTSGTAAANYYPAIIEANLCRTPILILTADRPPNLINTGANQTIDQHDLYGKHIRNFIDMGIPSCIETLMSKLRRGYLNATGISYNGQQVNPAGPVHLNFPFAEPLLDQNEFINPVIYKTKIFEKLKIHSSREIEQDHIEFPKNLLELITKTEKLLFICGEGLSFKEQVSLVKIIELMNTPIIADSTSGLRFGNKSDMILTNYERYIEKIPKPELIIRFGKKPNSKLLNIFLDNNKKKTVLFDPIGRFNDDVGHVHSFSISNLWKFFFELDTVTSFISPKKNEFNNTLIDLDKCNLYKNSDLFIEENIIDCLFKNMKENSNIFVGNSMPIRHVDKNVPSMEKKINLFSNRGASGIDGIISTAFGISAANPTSNNFLLIGDVSFFHDLNALHIGFKNSINLTIIVINNGGGKIFNKLNYSNYGIKSFEKFWITKPDLNIGQAVSLFKGKHKSIQSLKEFKYYISKNTKGLFVLECDFS